MVFDGNYITSKGPDAEFPFDVMHYINGSGGAIYTRHSTVIIANIILLNNSSPKHGGAVFFYQSDITLYNINATNNMASKYGGTISFYFCTQVYINGENSFINNYASSYGGALDFCNVISLNIAGVSYFEQNSAEHGGAVDLYDTRITVISGDIVFKNNNGTYYGGAIYIYNSTLVNSTGNMEYRSNIAEKEGGAIFLDLCDNIEFHGDTSFINNMARQNGGALSSHKNSQVNFHEDTRFINNTARQNGGALSSHTNSGVNFHGDTRFINNTARQNGGALSSHTNSGVNFHGDARFINNTARQNGGALSTNSQVNFHRDSLFITNHAKKNGGAISCNMNSQISFNGHSVFQKNHADGYGGAIYNLNSRIIYNSTRPWPSTNNEFQFDRNIADYGGAIVMIGTTKLILHPQFIKEIFFTENKAEYSGGAIFVDVYTSSECLIVTTDVIPDCFILLKSCYFKSTLNFINNNAQNYGSVLYGGSLNECRRFFSANNCVQFKGSAFDLVKEISSITPKNNASTKFSSKPSKICIYNENSDHDNCGSPMPMKLFPGQTFSVPMRVVDEYDNPIDGVVIRSTQNNNNARDYQIKHNVIMSNSTYQNFTFHVLVHNEYLVSNSSKLNFALFLESSCRNSTHFDISLQPCPNGFEFSPENGNCQCANVLQEFTTDCNIDYIAIGRSRNNFWLSFTDEYILFSRGGCPLDYCKDTKVYVPMNDSDVQCSHGRRGTLCGACNENNSLALGSLVCKQDCTVFHPLLILPIGVLGILLIVLLFLLHLTVAAGTINGLIFYANIVQANHQTFLPTDTAHPLKNFYTIFIGWLNLDFGIETCFYDEMDIYAYSWLQFSFPIYLWILMLIIIVSAHYSQRVSKIFGQNPVAVLATVLLISYGKMLKAIIVPLPWVVLEKVQNNSQYLEYVWLYNGDMYYFDFQHMLLVVFASFVLLFLFLPYSFLLLCGHWLQAKSHWRIFSWINKLKPFMDAYHAPFRKSERHWIGLLLLTRCGLILTIAFDASGLGNQNLNLLIVTFVTAGLSLFKGRVYDKWYNDFLESSFLLNLCILSAATLYVQSGKDEEMVYQNYYNATVSSVSVMIAFVCFIGIIIFHVYQRLRKFQHFQRVYKNYSLKKQRDEKVYSEQSMEMISNSSVSLRELLLDDDS